ncbi:Sua5/YciO/YrdC/YwlC family protein [Uniformispora flossi]|uniref:Sua5/YciO/YrdC/YwlC family protein n=1 Tax=Uniformispora flossi TaxID=3390723 RepID=UPI003C3021A4
MTRPGRAPATLDEARQALHDGAAVVLPNSAPLTRLVTARRPGTVNEAKARRADQPVALWAHHPDTLGALADIWHLDDGRSTMARRLLAEEHLTVLVPVRGTAVPAWALPAAKDGWMLLFGARRQPLRPLLDDHPVLYVSSANRTGHPPAATTAEALAMFPDTVPVVALAAAEDPDDRHDPRGRQATTTVRLHPDGRMEIHRRGAQDRAFAGPAEYLRHLRQQYSPAEGPGPAATEE